MFGSLGHFIGNMFGHPAQAQSPVSPGLLQAINHASGINPTMPQAPTPNPGLIQNINHAAGMPNRQAGVPGATPPPPNPGLLQAINHAAGLPNPQAGVPQAAPQPPHVSSSLLHAINAATGFQPHVAPQHPNLQPPDITYNPNPHTNIPYSSHNLQQVMAAHGRFINTPVNGVNDQTQGSYLTGMQGGSIFPMQWQQQYYGGNNNFQPSVAEGITSGQTLQGNNFDPQLLNSLYRSIF